MANALSELLQILQENNIMDLDDVRMRNMVETVKKDIILKNHPYDIFLSTDNRWHTYVIDNGKRKPIAKATREKVEDALVQFYKDHEIKSQCTLKTLYNDWLDHKALHTTASSYIRRIDDDWRRYYRNSYIIDIPINKLEYLELDKWAHKIIKDNLLTKRQFYNMQIIIKQCLIYAVDKGMILESPYEKIKVSSKLFYIPPKKEASTQVFLIDEQPKVEEEAYKDFKATNSVSPLAILLAFYTGLRVGEIVALKFSDIEDNYLSIQRIEVKEQTKKEDGSWNTPKYIVVDHAKTNAGLRKVYLTSKAREIIELIKKLNLKNGYSNDEFIFVNDKGRIHAPSLTYRIKKCCKKAGISKKSMHKIRKTYISTLIDNKVSIDTIMETVGHKDKRTTYGNYCFSRYSKKQTEDILEKALCG